MTNNPLRQCEVLMARRGARNTSGEVTEFLSVLDNCHDSRDAFALLQERIRSYQKAGQPPPEPLRRREQSMLIEFMAESQGR
jgi:hypothetical protein